MRSFNFSFWLFYVAFINGTFALAALAFTGTVITISAAFMATVPIGIRMPLIIALKLRSVPRKAKLEELLKKPSGVIRCSVSFVKDIEELLDRALVLGLEGLIGKRSGSKYKARVWQRNSRPGIQACWSAGKRTGAWIKIKLHLEQEFVIGGYAEPEGARKHFGALLVGFYEGKQLKFGGRVGTGFSDKLLRSLFAELGKIRAESCPFINVPAAGRSRWDQGLTAAEMKRCHWVKPVMVCQIKFTEWTRDDRLRHPVFLGIREDKNANEVVRENAS